MMSGWNLAFLNRPGPAIEALEHAIRLSPLDPLSYLFATALTFAYSVAGQYEEAVEWADRALQEQPRFVIPVRLKTALCAHLDRTGHARMPRPAVGAATGANNHQVQDRCRSMVFAGIPGLVFDRPPEGRFAGRLNRASELGGVQSSPSGKAVKLMTGYGTSET
jgi:tetratricopeptide (TPR) repeat protein